MALISVLLFISLALRTLGAPRPQLEILGDVNRCATGPLPEELRRVFGVVGIDKHRRQLGLNFPNTEIPTWFHVIQRSQGGSSPVTETKAREQIEVLNDDFGPHGFSFVYAGMTRISNDAYVDDPFGTDQQFKSESRRGNYRTLNIWIHPELERALGYATFPTVVTTGGPAFRRDGVVVWDITLPGGTAPYDLGRTATHEVGHWLGLAHVFTDGTPNCALDNDFVATTPIQGQPSFGCPVNKNSCPNQPGFDSIRNYMDYSDDSCMTEFNTEQGLRMRTLYTTFRAGR